MAEVQFTDEAIGDLQQLDGSVLRLVLGRIAKLESSPTLGKVLGRRRIGDLTGYRKLSVGDRQWRIIYELRDDESIVVLWVIGSRKDEACYLEMLTRLERDGSPPAIKLATAMQTLTPATQKRVLKIHPDWADTQKTDDEN